VTYATSLEEVLWGITLVAVTMSIHGCGMLATLLACHTVRRGTAPLSFFRGGTVLILASWMIVLVHLVELLVWAAFFLWEGAMPTASSAYYFALMQYTTVGSDFSLPQHWRLLGGMLPMAGLMTFAWSTGILFTLAQEFQSAQLSVIQRRRAERGSLKHERTNRDRTGP
jgi:hypothetical protein